MFPSRQITIALLAWSLLPMLCWGAQQGPQHRRARVKAVAGRQADPVAPPPLPLTPEQLPAQPPQVSYLNGQLTIISRNSTLADILHAVSRQTGAVIELPPGGGFERVAGRMGPGTARDVLAELLNGSRYDYVMIASAANPRGLQHVILTPKTAGGAEPMGNGPVAAYQPQPQQPVISNEVEMPPDATADDQEAPTAEEPPMEAQQPDQAQQNPQASVPGAPQPGTQQMPGVKTPEQLLQELQRMQQLQQQQQRQQQQQQNPR